MQALKRVVDHPIISKQLSIHEQKVASLLLQDFEKSGVHMPLKDREKFIQLNDQIQVLGQEFTTKAYPRLQTVSFNLADANFDGIPTKLLNILMKSKAKTGRKLVIPTSSEVAAIFLKTAKSEKIRKDVFLALNSASRSQLDTLEDMLKKRAELAKLLGKESYGHMYLVDKMAGTPGIFYFDS